MFVANELIERTRPHACGEWRRGVGLGKIDIFGFAKQIVHR